MKVLGLVGSARRFGNSEIAVREALLGVEEAGGETELLRLTDYEIKPCTGCMRCVFKVEECPVKDDVAFLLDKIAQADGLVLGVPNYILGAAGILKMLTDRAMKLMFVEPRPTVGKPAAAIVPFGVEGWEGFAMAQVSIFLLSLGYRVVDQFMIRCQGPGEAVLDDMAMRRCREAGKRVVVGERSPYLSGVCPVCHNNIFEIVDLRVRCPVCDIYGHIIVEDGRLSIKFDDPADNRWTEENMVRHFERNMLPSVERYLSLKGQIKERLAKYRKK